MDLKLPSDAGDAQVQMAPMIDMVFLLLIFFMVASHFNQLEKVEIDVPVASHAKVPEELTDRRTITIKKDGTIYLGNRPSTLEEVGPAIEQHRRQVPGLKLFLRADEDLDHAEVRAVMEECAEAGASEIIFAAFESD